MAGNDRGTSANYFHVGGSDNKIHIGDVTNHIYPETNWDQQVYARKLSSRLRNWHSEQNRLIQCLPDDDEEFLQIENDYSPVDIRDIRDVTNQQRIELSGVINDEKKVHIAGDAGSGKSTLIKKMCYDWGRRRNVPDHHHHHAYLARFRFVFNIPLRLVGGKTIKEFVFDLIEDDEFDEKRVRKLLNQYEEETLFFLDGLDEIANGGKMLNAIFDCYPDATFVITSRFAWDQKMLLQAKFKRCLRLEGFTDKGIEIFRRNYFRKVPDSGIYVKQLIKSDDACAKKCIENFKCPLFLQLFCYCFKFSPRREPLKVTQLYQEMFKILRQKSEERGGEGPISEERLNSALKSFGKIALKGLLDSTILFSQDEVVDPVIINFGFLRQVFIWNFNNRKVKKFQPIHQTFLEFLAAFYMKDLLLTNLSEFEQIIATLPERLIHSKKSSTGSTISLFIIFLCGLLGENAFLFFKVMESKLAGRFKSLEKFSLLLWHAGDGELSKNIEYFSQSHRLTHTCLFDHFKKSYDNFSNIAWNVISNALKHPECRLNKLRLDEGILNKFDWEIGRLVVETLSNNKSITELELVKIGTGSFSDGVYEDVLQRNFAYFICIVESMPLLTKIAINQDIFIDKISVHVEFIANLMAAIKKLPHLQKLSISTTPVMSNISDSFIDKNVSDSNITNPITPGKKDRKKAKPTLTDDHFKLFVQSCHFGLEELHFSRLHISTDTARNLNVNRFLGLHELKLPFLKCDDLCFIFTLLSKRDCKLKHLDLTKYEFKGDELRKLLDAVKTNKSLKYLNLAQAQSDENALRCLSDCLTHNRTLGHLNVSSADFVINEREMKTFLYACLSSRVKELHLSGWTFKITKLQTFDEIVKMAAEFDTLEEMCLKGAKFNFYSYSVSGMVFDRVVSFFHNLINCTQLRVVDVRECVVRYEWVERPEIVHSDSGYSSLDAFDVSIEIPAPIVRKPEEKKLIDLRNSLTSEKIIFTNWEWTAYRFQ